MKHKITLISTFIALILSVYFLQESDYFTLLFCFIIVIYIALASAGSGLIQLNYFVNNINKGELKGVSFTFDDGPDSKITPQILDVLAAENVKATFFIIGNKVEKNKDLLLRIYNEGHTIGNHSYSHTIKLTMFSTSKLKKDIAKCSSCIEKVIHQKPLFFRPPFGVTTPRYHRALKFLNMKSIGWTLRSLDTVAETKEALYKKVVTKIAPGSIVLFHDTQDITLSILTEIIHYCKKSGIEIVPLPELIKSKAYE